MIVALLDISVANINTVGCYSILYSSALLTRVICLVNKIVHTSLLTTPCQTRPFSKCLPLWQSDTLLPVSSRIESGIDNIDCSSYLRSVLLSATWGPCGWDNAYSTPLRTQNSSIFTDRDSRAGVHIFLSCKSPKTCSCKIGTDTMLNIIEHFDAFSLI